MKSSGVKFQAASDNVLCEKTSQSVNSPHPLGQQVPEELPSLKKKCSIKTAASYLDRNDSNYRIPSEKLLSDFDMSNIELFQRQNSCRIDHDNDGRFPESFQLINIEKKRQGVGIEDFLTPSFSVLSYSVIDLIRFSSEMIFSNKFAVENFAQKEIEELLTNIACNYNNVSYHNFSHAFSLMQLHFQCLHLIPEFQSKFSQEELFYGMIAGLSHDINHNGTNNIFEVKRKTNLAKLYKNESVLENMHVATLWTLLDQNPALDFRNKATDSQKAKKIITRLILSTDMSHHFKGLEVLTKKRKERQSDSQRSLTDCLEAQSEEKWMYMEEMFHACDLGNPTLEFDSYISWAALLSYEFNEQSKLQRHYEVQVTKNFEFKNMSTLYNDQVWFVGKIVYPLWKELSLNLPQLHMFEKKISENIDKLNEKLTEEELKMRS